MLEAVGLTLGAAAFLLGHGVAIVLYLRNRRADLSPSQRGLAFVLAVATPLIAWLLTRDADVALYAVGLGLMAATAWTSRFPRYRAGIGAVMFVASDLAIFDGISGSSVLGAAIWPLYFTGQALIALSVVQTLAAARSGNTGTRTTPRRR